MQDPSDGSWKPLGSSITAACKDLSPVTISGQLINDNNDNAGPDTGENVYTGNATITIDPPVGGSAVPSWNAAHDTYTFTGAVPGTVYTLSVNVNGVPNRYVSTVVPLSIPLGVNAPSFAVQDIYIGRLYQITGKVFEDTDKDKEFNNPAHTPPDALFTKGGSVRITGTGVDTTAPVNTTTAVYLITGLKASIPYTLTYTPPAPPDFKGFTPLINPYVAVSTGPDNCPSMIAAQKFGTLCDNTTFPTVNGDIKELNFPITNSTPWIQYVGSNVRVDSGFANPVPKTVNPTCQDPNADPASNPLNKPYSVNTK